MIVHSISRKELESMKNFQKSMILLGAAAMVAGCHSQSGEAMAGHGGQMPPPEAGVFAVKAEALAMTTELPGRTSAYQVAEVRPQVGGLIQKRLFTEGADVKAGS